MPVQITSMTIAATNIETMAAFYNATLDCDFQLLAFGFASLPLKF